MSICNNAFTLRIRAARQRMKEREAKDGYSFRDNSPILQLCVLGSDLRAGMEHRSWELIEDAYTLLHDIKVAVRREREARREAERAKSAIELS